MVYKIEVEKNVFYVESDNQVSALHIVVREICASKFKKRPDLETVNAFQGYETIKIEALTPSILK